MFVKSIKNLRGLVLIGVVAVLGATNTAATENSNPTIAVTCLLYTSPSPRDATLSRMPSSA